MHQLNASELGPHLSVRCVGGATPATAPAVIRIPSGVPWIIRGMVYIYIYGLLWFNMVLYGLLWFDMVLTWFYMVLLWVNVVLYGLAWFYMVLQCLIWFDMV